MYLLQERDPSSHQEKQVTQPDITLSSPFLFTSSFIFLDVSIANPLSTSTRHASLLGTLPQLRESSKTRRYKALLEQNPGSLFFPLCFSSLGQPGPKAIEFLTKILKVSHINHRPLSLNYFLNSVTAALLRHLYARFSSWTSNLSSQIEKSRLSYLNYQFQYRSSLPQ